MGDIFPGGFLALYDPAIMPPLTSNATVWSNWCFEHPKNDLCINYIDSYYEYRIELAPNIAFLVLFCLSFLGFVSAFATTRNAFVFNLSLSLGCVCEIIGYVGRIISWKNQWDMNGFLVQIVCLTIGPAFMAAGVYLCLRRIVELYGKENSLVAPTWYTRFFIPCDVLALILQATGGAVAAIALSEEKDIMPGTHVMVAGLSVQVFTGFFFILAAAIFVLRLRHRTRTLGLIVARNQDPHVLAIISGHLFHPFLYALGLASFLILWRSAFRVAELSKGWNGPVTKHQGMFIGFEGVLIVVACIGLNVLNPAWVIGPRMDGAGLRCCGARGKKTGLRRGTKNTFSSGDFSSSLVAPEMKNMPRDVAAMA